MVVDGLSYPVDAEKYSTSTISGVSLSETPQLAVHTPQQKDTQLLRHQSTERAQNHQELLDTSRTTTTAKTSTSVHRVTERGTELY